MNRNVWWAGATLLGMTLVITQIPCNGADDEKSKNDNGKTATSRENGRSTSRDNDRPSPNDGQRWAFLGVMVEELHPAFGSHLPGSGVKGQGLMVEEVGPDSPAGKAGIKTHDILMKFDDQKLFTPEQFIKLIHSDKPGREVTFGLIREGKPQTVKVTLGERDPKWDPHQFAHHPMHHGRQFGWGWPGHGQAIHDQQTQSDNDNPHWNSFDSLTLKKLDKDRFHASVAFTNKDGKLQKHEYEGTRDEIRKKIDDDKDLLPNERFHLIRGLDLEGNLPVFLLPHDQGFDF